MTDVILVAVIVAFFVVAAWAVRLLGRVTASAERELASEHEQDAAAVDIEEIRRPLEPGRPA
jgi:hypothetical protein